MDQNGNILSVDTISQNQLYRRNETTVEDNLTLQNAVYMLAYSLTGILALLGNIIVVHVVFSLPKMRTFVHILLANMAISDIVCAISFYTGLIACSDAIITNGGNAYCVTNKAVQLLTFQVTSVSMTAIAIDRWLSVFFPFYHNEMKHQNWRVVKVIVGIWIASVAVILGTSPSLAYQRYFNSNGMLIKCEMAKVLQVFGSSVKTERIQLVAANLLHFWIPLAVISGAYGSISLKVWRRKLGNDLTQSQMNLIIFQKWKTIKMLIATVTVFTFSWLPFFVFNIIAFKSDSSKKRPCTQNMAFLLVIWMAFSSCCYNPLVYWIYNKTYRHGILMFLNAFKCYQRGTTLRIQGQSKNTRQIQCTTLWRSDS